MPRFTQQEIREFEIMQKNINNKKNGVVREELENPADIIIINKENRLVESITVWQEIKNIARLKNLIARVQAEWMSSEVVCVLHRSVGLGELIKNEQIIVL